MQLQGQHVLILGLGASGLAIIPRYTMLAASILAIFAMLYPWAWPKFRRTS